MNIRGRVAGFAAAALVTVAVPLALRADPAMAHGAMVYPATRTYACYLDGQAGGGGDLNPTNSACVAAIAEGGGKQTLWDWYAVLISNAAGQHQAIIPDGQLCGAGTAKYSGFNQARTDWPTTELQSGAPITFRYNGWAPHPGTWSQYVTKDGWDPTQPLTWADLEATPFDEVTNPPLSSGTSGAEYVWDGTLPNKTGRHIIYSIWQRSDSPEAFYNCSDVNFGGGGTPTTSPTESPTDSPTGSPTDSPTESPSGEPTTSPSATAGATGACTATIAVTSSWQGGYQAEVTVRNTGTAALSPWTVGWTMPSGASIVNGWNATVSQTGSTVSATAPTWTPALAAGAATTVGYVASGSAATLPTPITLNGATCA